MYIYIYIYIYTPILGIPLVPLKKCTAARVRPVHMFAYTIRYDTIRCEAMRCDTIRIIVYY